MFSCKKAAILLTRELDGELGGLGVLRLRCHLLICSVCRTLRGQLALQKKAAGQLDGDNCGAACKEPLPDAARQRILARLHEEEE